MSTSTDTDTIQESDDHAAVMQDYLAAQRPGEDGLAPIERRPRQVRDAVPDEPSLTRPSIALDPGLITAISEDPEVTPYLTSALSTLEAAHKGVQAIIDARESARTDPTLNEAGQVLRVGDYADKVSKRVLPMFDATRNNLAKAIKDLDTSLRQFDAASTDAHMATEIRSFVRNLNPGEREKLIREAMSTRDTRTLGALLKCPPFLVGMTAEVQEVHVQAYRRLQNPQAAKRLDAMKVALERIEAAGPIFLKQSEQAMGAKWSTVAKLSAKKAKADKAFAV